MDITIRQTLEYMDTCIRQVKMWQVRNLIVRKTQLGLGISRRKRETRLDVSQTYLLQEILHCKFYSASRRINIRV
jgi:hypothetical protein